MMTGYLIGVIVSFIWYYAGMGRLSISDGTPVWFVLSTGLVLCLAWPLILAAIIVACLFSMLGKLGCLEL